MDIYEAVEADAARASISISSRPPVLDELQALILMVSNCLIESEF
jgi:hypothetical protein